MDLNMLYNAFVTNGLDPDSANKAAISYKNCEFYLGDNPTQEDYNGAVREEMSYWEN